MRFALALAVLCLAAASAEAQPTGPGPANPADDSGWASFGLGAIGSEPISAFLSLNYGRDCFGQLLFNSSSSLLGARGTGVIGVGMGRSWVDRSARGALSLGLALGQRSETRRDQHATGGVFVNAQGFVTPIKEVGLGIDAFAHTYGGSRFLGEPRLAYGLRFTFVIEGNK
jgi:hypothetical protein